MEKGPSGPWLIEGGLCPPETWLPEQDPEPALVAIRGVGPWEGRSPSRVASEASAENGMAPPVARGRRPPQHDRGTTLVSRGPRRVCEPGRHHLF